MVEGLEVQPLDHRALVDQGEDPDLARAHNEVALGSQLKKLHLWMQVREFIESAYLGNFCADARYMAKHIIVSM